MKWSALLRGGIWIAVGLIAHLVGVLAGRPLVMRGTGWPWGLVVAGIGVVILGWDLWKGRREPGKKEGGE